MLPRVHRVGDGDNDDGGGGGGAAAAKRRRRLLTAMRIVCRVLDVAALKQEEAAAGLASLATEAQSCSSWANRLADWDRCCCCCRCRGDRDARLQEPPDRLLHYHSDADADGVTATQEVEFARTATAAAAVAATRHGEGENDDSEDETDDDEDEEEEEETGLFIWFLYTRAGSPYKAGLIYSPDSGSWTQFLIALETAGGGGAAERLMATHSEAFSPACPHLIGGLRRLLLNLKSMVLRLQG